MGAGYHLCSAMDLRSPSGLAAPRGSAGKSYLRSVVPSYVLINVCGSALAVRGDRGGSAAVSCSRVATSNMKTTTVSCASLGVCVSLLRMPILC